MKLYLDTSVFGGCFDIEFESSSKKLFKEIFDHEHTVTISNITLNELEKSPDKVRLLLDKVLKYDVELLNIDKEVDLLAKHYIQEKVIT